MNFQRALRQLKVGERVRRSCWASGMYAELYKNKYGQTTIFTCTYRGHKIPIQQRADSVPHKFSQEDILATDWRIT